MKWLDLISSDPIEGRKTIARCALTTDDAVVEIQGEPWIVRDLNRGFRGHKNGQPAIITPKDGLHFLHAIGRHYNSHLFVASLIQEGAAPQFNTVPVQHAA